MRRTREQYHCYTALFANCERLRSSIVTAFQVFKMSKTYERLQYHVSPMSLIASAAAVIFRD